MSAGDEVVVSADRLTLAFGSRTLWEELSFELHRGEFLALLGPNGTGKTSLVRILLGLLAPTSGTVRIGGQLPGRVRSTIGYVPQQHAFDPELPLRGRDLVGLGLDGHRWGIGFGGGSRGARIERALDEVDAGRFADSPVGRLSGGEQQRLRIAQALVSDPTLLLADEPLLSLDPASQQTVTGLLDQRRRRAGTPIVFVTHDINPILSMVDRVLYLAAGHWAIGSIDQVLTSETLSHIYQAPVDVLRVRGRIVVVGTPEDYGAHHDHGPVMR